MRKFIRLTIAVLCVSIAAFTCFACGETEPEPKEKTVLDSPVIASSVYTGEKQTAAVPESDGYTVTTNDGGISAGNYDVVLTLTDAESYAWKTPDESNAATVTLKFTITKADNEITSLTIADWFYGKEANKPVAAAKFGTPSFTYSTAEDGEYTAAVPTAAGKYFVKAAVEGTNDYSGAEKVVSFEIKKAKPAYTELPEAVENLKYDGSAHALVAAGATADGTVEYRLGEDGEWSENIPTATNAGSYEVWYRIKGDDAHADIEAEEPIAVVIAQADVTVTAPTAKTGLEYTGASLALVEPGSVTAGTMMYRIGGEGGWSESVPTAVNAGKYTVQYTVTVDENYKKPQDGEVEIVIAKANATVTAPTAKTLTYTGSAQELIAAGSVVGGKMQYKLSAETEWSDNIPTATNAGTYTVEYKVVPDGNHNAVEGGSVEVTIDKIDASVAAPTVKTGLAYTGEAKELIAAGSVVGGKMQYKLSAETEWSENIPTATNAGTYTVEYKIVPDDNHNAAEGGSVEVTIDKIDASVTAPTAKTGLAYTGEAKELIAAGSVVGGKMQYKLSAETEWSENIPTATNAGTYTVEYKIVPDDNHNAAEGGSVEVTIAKVDMVITHPTGIEGLVYTGEALVVVNKGSVIGGKIEFFNNANDTWSEIPPTKTNAGNYQYRYRVVADGNHKEITKEYRVSFKIAKMANSVKFDTASMDVTYPAVPAPKATATFGEITYTYATVENKDNAKAYGEWKTIVSAGAGRQYYCKATAAGDDNHETATEIRLFTVHKGTAEISEFKLASETLKCGEALGYTAKATGGEAFIRFSSGENGQYDYKTLNELLAAMLKSDPSNAIGNGFTYWVKAFVSENEFYLGAQSDARSFVLNHDFIDGVCKGCGHAQTGITYGETETEAYVTGYSGNHSKEVYILAEYNGKPVTYIDYKVVDGNISTPFKERTTITKIVLPSSITVLKGYAFFGCSALEYLAMPGVTTFEDVNNLTFCHNLKTLIVKDGLTIDNQQLQSNDDAKNGITNVYVDGTTAVNFSSPHLNKLVGKIFYLGDGVKCFTWKFDENGKIKTGPVKHNYEGGKCSVCGFYMLEYAYDSANSSYYVKGFAAGVNEEEVVIVEKYDDGTNGEHPVTYVANRAFEEKSFIRRVIMPSVTDLGGMSFFNCSALEYIDMRGVTYISYWNKDESGNAKRPDGLVESNNNFLNCFNLKTVIVGNGYHAEAQQFATTDTSAYSKAKLYVNGTTAAQMDVNDRIIDCNVFYLGDGVKCLTWKFDENGKIKTGPKHNYGTDGKCTLCQADSGVEYAYDSANQTYYVKGLKTGVTVQEVVIVEKYNDGTNGEHPVTYVANRAFAEKSFIRRVIMPSVTDLGGMSFFNCSALEYIDMSGVTYISYANKDESGNAKRPDGSVDSNNNFLNCFNIKTVIVGSGYRADAQQFVSTDPGQVNKADLYVYGAAAPTKDGGDNLLTDKVYYYNASNVANAWHYEGGVATLWETAQA